MLEKMNKTGIKPDVATGVSAGDWAAFLCCYLWNPLEIFKWDLYLVR